MKIRFFARGSTFFFLESTALYFFVFSLQGFESLKYLFENNGLEIFKIEENDINGGSYRIFCRKLNKGSIKLAKENVLTSVKKFVKRVKNNKSVTMKFIKKEVKKGKKIFLYGASTKGNTLLQYYNLNNKIIPYAAERSPENETSFPFTE